MAAALPPPRHHCDECRYSEIRSCLRRKARRSHLPRATTRRRRSRPSLRRRRRPLRVPLSTVSCAGHDCLLAVAVLMPAQRTRRARSLRPRLPDEDPLLLPPSPLPQSPRRQSSKRKPHRPSPSRHLLLRSPPLLHHYPPPLRRRRRARRMSRMLVVPPPSHPLSTNLHPRPPLPSPHQPPAARKLQRGLRKVPVRPLLLQCRARMTQRQDGQQRGAEWNRL